MRALTLTTHSTYSVPSHFAGKIIKGLTAVGTAQDPL